MSETVTNLKSGAVHIVSAMGDETIKSIAGQIDALEVLNARCIFPNSFDKALALSRRHGIAQSAGSDAHSLPEIGNAYVEMPEFNGKEDFLEALKQGKICGHRSNPLVHVSSVWSKLQTLLQNSGSNHP